jgi:hypothetical protein
MRRIPFREDGAKGPRLRKPKFFAQARVPEQAADP